MDISKLTLGERIVLGAGVVLIIDLLFLPWHRIDLGVVSASQSGVESPNAFYGVIALLVALVMVGQIVASKFTSAKLPDPPVPWTQIHLIAGGVILGALIIKLIAETDFLGFGAYLGVVLAAAIAYGAFTMTKESGAAV